MLNTCERCSVEDYMHFGLCNDCVWDIARDVDTRQWR
jgi:hypothetical protein